MRKKSILVLMVAVVSMIGALTSCKGAEPVTSYKIGAILAQTGNYTGLGLQSLEGIQVMVDEINDGGGINGIPVELVVYDDKSEATEAALAAKKLIEVDKVHVLVAGTVTMVLNFEEEFINFINNSTSITPRMHALKLLPGIGKKHMWEIIEERERQKFVTFSDISDRTSISNPAKQIALRIIKELQREGIKYYLFSKTQKYE